IAERGAPRRRRAEEERAHDRQRVRRPEVRQSRYERHDHEWDQDRGVERRAHRRQHDHARVPPHVAKLPHPLPARRSYGTIARQVKVMSRVRLLRLEWTLSLTLIAIGLAWAGIRGLPVASLCRPTARAIGTGATFGALLWFAMPVLFLAPGMRHVRDTML